MCEYDDPRMRPWEWERGTASVITYYEYKYSFLAAVFGYALLLLFLCSLSLVSGYRAHTPLLPLFSISPLPKICCSHPGARNKKPRQSLPDPEISPGLQKSSGSDIGQIPKRGLSFHFILFSMFPSKQVYEKLVLLLKRMTHADDEIARSSREDGTPRIYR